MNREVFNWNGTPLKVISPGDHARFKIDQSQDINSQRLHIEAVSAIDLSEVKIWLDNQLVASLSEPPYELWWTLVPGNHTCWAEGVSNNGEAIISPATSFVVEDGN
jgi:hypothetical protein